MFRYIPIVFSLSQAARGVIQEFEENNSGVDLFHFDSDEDVF